MVARRSRARAAKLFDDPLAAMFLAAVTDEGVSNGGKLPRLGPAVDDGSSAVVERIPVLFLRAHTVL